LTKDQGWIIIGLLAYCVSCLWTIEGQVAKHEGFVGFLTAIGSLGMAVVGTYYIWKGIF
jgi:hypothetical protein